MAQAVVAGILANAISGNGDQAAQSGPIGPVSTPVGRPVTPFQAPGGFGSFLSGAQSGFLGQPSTDPGIANLIGSLLGQRVGQGVNPIIPGLAGQLTGPATRVAPAPPPMGGKT